MKQVYLAIFVIIALLTPYGFMSHAFADYFTEPPGCYWGTVNPEPDIATAIARTADDGFIVGGFVPYTDPNFYQSGDEKGGYAILYKLDDAGVREFYNSYADETLFYCDPGMCVTCGATPDVTDFSSKVTNADLNGDNTIDEGDLELFAGHFGS